MLLPFNPIAAGTVQRLSEDTRTLAADYLAGRYRDRLKPASFHVEELRCEPDYPPELLHMRCATMIAERADLHILPGEKLAGTAPFLESLLHLIPGMDQTSISHTTVDFGNAVGLGLSGLEKEIMQRWEDAEEVREKVFCEALLGVIAAMRIWIKRYLSAYRLLLASEKYPEQKENFRRIIATLQASPENPPSSFREAIQSFWIFFEFQRLCGNWSGLGRFDKILGKYLRKDMADGTISLDEARELIAHFWIKGSEWCHGKVEGSLFAPASGDAQVYQNILLAGIDSEGNEVENDVTYLVLDVIEELHISDYPVAVRLHANSSERLLKRVAEIQLLGGGIVSVYNEDVVIKGLLKFGYPLSEAREFTNDGCWEVIIPGKTAFGYMPFDALKCFQDALFDDPIPENSEQLYCRYLKYLESKIGELRQQALAGFYRRDAHGNYEALEESDVVLSLLMPSCRQSARSYQAHGPKYLVRAIHPGGLPDIANSMTAIRRLVDEQKRITLAELREILRSDWLGQETLRLQVAGSIFYYGNDDEEADRVMKRVFDDYSEIVAAVPKVLDVLMPAGVSTFGREIEFAKNRLATAFGKHAHEYLSPNLSPTPGTDRLPLTAILNSYCKMDFTRTPNGCPLDLRLNAGINKVPNAADALMRILQVFVQKGGMYLQIDVVDPDVLRRAQRDPDLFPNLVVRISGWSARFATLDRKWQDMIINRTAANVL